METKKITTQQILEINVSGKTEKKNGLTYLSWAWAWDKVLRDVDENATYEIHKFFGKPYDYDENLGYLVMTSLTINGITREMWLPVMDGANNAMKAQPYTYKTKYGEKKVEGATMFDINKTIMRCLTKNIAMFGLGLYIYAGEDLPEMSEEAKLNELLVLEEKLAKCTTKQQARDLYKEYEGKGKEFADKIMARGKELSE